MANGRTSTYDLKLQADRHEERINNVEKTVAVHEDNIYDLKVCTKDLKDDMKEMREVLISSKMAIKIGTWILILFGGSVIALIWSLITGQASILFK